MCPPSVSTLVNLSHRLQRSSPRACGGSLSVWQTDVKRRTRKKRRRRNSCNCPAVMMGRGTVADSAVPLPVRESNGFAGRWGGLSKTGSCWSSSGVPPLPRGHRTVRRGGRNAWAHLLRPAPAARSCRLAVGRQMELFQGTFLCWINQRCLLFISERISGQLTFSCSSWPPSNLFII